MHLSTSTSARIHKNHYNEWFLYRTSYRNDSITFVISESNAWLLQSEKVYSLKIKACNSSEVMRRKKEREKEIVNTNIVKSNWAKWYNQITKTLETYISNIWPKINTFNSLYKVWTNEHHIIPKERIVSCPSNDRIKHEQIDKKRY